MDDYRVFVFQDFLVFENPKIGNAAFFLPLTQAIDLDKRVFNVPSSKRLNDETRQEIIDEMIAPVVSNVKTKGQLLDLNAIRVIHVPEEKNWVERMEKEIEQLSASTHQ
jgi:hypothetical protein